MNDADYEKITIILLWFVMLEIGVLLLVAGMWFDMTYPLHPATPEEIGAATSMGAPIPLNGLLKLGGIIFIVVWLGSMFSAHIHYQPGRE